MRQNYKSAFGLLFALLFLISNLVPFLPQNGFASMLFEEDPTEGSTGEASTSNIEICDNIVDDDGDGLIDNQDVVDCPATAGPILTPTPEAEEEAATEEEPTPTPEADEEAATEEEQADEESETEICDNTIDDDGDGLVDTEDSEDCPAPEEEAATEEEPTPTPEADEEAATEEEPTPTPEADEEAATEEEQADEESETEICDNTIDD
ncbi:MAG: hypothetical protein WAL42_06030, partial [Nitrososphaeraceae archaeon]